MKKLISFFIVGALLTAGLVGCSKADDAAAGTTAGTETPAKDPAKQTEAEADK